MYQQLTPLKPADHTRLRLRPVSDYRFARGELVAPIVIDEIADVAREFPIVFPVGSRLPVALMGVEKDANAYVGSDGKWLATYIPAYIRHYPLAITRLPVAPAAAPAKAAGAATARGKKGKGQEAAAAEPRFAVLLDVAAACVSEHEGEPIFDADGKPGGPAQQKLRLLELMQSRAGNTQALVQAIEQAGLLLERSIRIQRSGEPDRQVTGIRVIDEARLNQLDDAAFNRLRKRGALPLVYASLLSWANFRQGPIGRSHPLPEPSPTFEDDVIRFN